MFICQNNSDLRNVLIFMAVNYFLNFKLFMKKLFIFSVILLMSSGMVSFNNDGPISSNSNVTFKAVLNGGSTVFDNTSAATGTATLIFNATTKIFSLTVTYTGLSALSGHITNDETGFNDPIIFPLSDLTTSITYISVALDAAQEADLYANLYTIKLNSAAYPDGEIQGLLIKEDTAMSSGGSPPPPPGLNKLHQI